LARIHPTHDHGEARRVADEPLDQERAQAPVETQCGEDQVGTPQAVEAEHEAALPGVVLELLSAQVDARYVPRRAGALDGELGCPGHERLRSSLEDVRRQEEATEVFRTAGAADFDARGGKGVSVPRRPRA